MLSLVLLLLSADGGLAPGLIAPSVLPPALCEELRSPRALPEEIDQAAVAAERKALEKLSAQIARSRKALKTETERLVALTAKAAAPVPKVAVAPPPPPPPSDAQQLVVLAKTIKSMKAPEAAQLLAHVEPALAIALLRRLSPKSAASVISKLQPELAATFVAALATPAPPEAHP